MDPNRKEGSSRTTGSDMIEPADHKSKATEGRSKDDDSRHSNRPNPRPPYSMSSVARFSTPNPIAETVFVNINTYPYIPYFKSLWEALVGAIYPNSHYHPTGVISKSHFVNLCRVFLKERLEIVEARCTSIIPDAYSHPPNTMELPVSFATVLDGIGMCTTYQGGVRIVPRYVAEPKDEGGPLTDVTVAHVTNFEKLVIAAKLRGYIRTAWLSDEPTGSTWWLLSARKSASIMAVADGYTDNVIITAAIEEWSTRDALIAALVQNSFEGIPPTDNRTFWRSNNLLGVIGLRRSFNLRA